MSSKRPGVGVGVFITSPAHPRCILMGKRKGGMGAGQYALPGGHLEFGEEFEACARRELKEETGLELRHVTCERTFNAVWENVHYVLVIMKAEVDMEFLAEPENVEPDKCFGWEWFNWDVLPPAEQRFTPMNIILESGYRPFSCETTSSLQSAT